MAQYGRKVRELREAKALTQSQLAELVNTTQATISRIERGNIIEPRSSLEKRLGEILTPGAVMSEPLETITITVTNQKGEKGSQTLDDIRLADFIRLLEFQRIDANANHYEVTREGERALWDINYGYAERVWRIGEK